MSFQNAKAASGGPDENGREADFAQKYVVEGGRVYLRAALKAQDENDRVRAKAFEKRIEERLKDSGK